MDQGEFSYKKVNVRDQQTYTESFLNWMERLIRVRKEIPEIGEGDWMPLPTDQPGKVFAHRGKANSHSTVAVFNARPNWRHSATAGCVWKRKSSRPSPGPKRVESRRANGAWLSKFGEDKIASDFLT